MMMLLSKLSIQVLPSAQILLCHFHVIKCVKGEIAKLVINIEEKVNLLSQFKRVVYSRTQEQYEENKTELIAMAPADFGAALTKNWFSRPGAVAVGAWCTLVPSEQITSFTRAGIVCIHVAAAN